ncbi:MAG TPA: HAMP domain-containing sensor histidine kinase, partial [Candidatus Omnitrophota bacterium]|nr:HAMP domain-containing sensor histidine kinase [Candidatus Omnitrophota bacterium]
PSPADLEREVAERMAAEQEVRSINRGLEQRVLDRTRALERAKDEAIRANQAKTRFLAAASHDLRQPFQALRLFFEVLDQRLADHAVRPVLDMAKQALDGGESLLHALLDISTLQAGTVKIRPVRFVVDEVLQQVANEMGPTAAAKGIVLRVVPCRTEVVNDPVLVKRLVRNLVSNAVRYTDRGRILLGCRRSGGRVRIEVWDTGIGIPESARQEIFEEFTQLGNPERDRTKGLGLGLAIVRRLAQLLDTELDLDSEVGRGTVFRVTLPHTLPAGAPMPEEIGA